MRNYFASMSTREMVVEELKRLTDAQTEVVLKFVQELSASERLTASDLMHLPSAERRQILERQAREAELLYRNHPETIVEDAEPPLAYD